MATKQEILYSLSEYSQETLEKLLVVADSILTPLDIGLVDNDFPSLVDLVFKDGGLADTYFPEWTDRGKADFGRLIIELCALFSDKDFFYINHFANEAFVTTASLYSNLLHHAISNGINVTNNRGASSIFTLTFEAGAETTYPKGSVLIGVDGTDLFTFSNKEEFTIAESTGEITQDVEFIHGLVKQTAGTYDGRSIVLPDRSVVEKTITLTIDSAPYTEVETFSNNTSTAHTFKAYYNEEGEAEIIFAENSDYGVSPSEGAWYEVSYFIGGGSIGNLPAGTLNNVVGCPYRQITTFTQPEATGGNDMLSLEALRAQTINRQNHNNRAVTKEDTEAIVRELSFIHNVYVEPVSNYVFVWAVPKSETPLSATEAQEIEDYLNDGRLLMGYGVIAAAPSLVTVTLVIDVYVLPNVSASVAQAQADEAIKSYLAPYMQADFGEGVKRGRLSELILRKVTGSQNVVFTECNEGSTGTGSPNDIHVNSSQMIDYLNSNITVNVIGGQ
jgi:hypothetical protein